MTQQRTASASESAVGASAPAAVSVLEATLGDLEERMLGLREALKSGDPRVLDLAADQLKTSLSAAQRSLLASTGLRPASLEPYRERLRLAAVELQTQREALARAAAAVERAAVVLLPNTETAYDAQGLGIRPQAHGSVTA